MSITNIATAVSEATPKAWNIGDKKFDAIVETASKAMAETPIALAYALSQAFDNSNPNKLNDFMSSDLCTKAEIEPSFERKMRTWDAKKKIEYAGSIPMYRKQIAQGGALLAYLRHYKLLAYTTKDENTGDNLYVDGPLTYSKGKFSYTKDNEDNKGGPSVHWRTQLSATDDEGNPLLDIEDILSDIVGEKWWQFSSKGVKVKLNVEKRLASLAKSAIKAADDTENDAVSHMSEQVFVDLARKAYKATVAAMAQ